MYDVPLAGTAELRSCSRPAPHVRPIFVWRPRRYHVTSGVVASGAMATRGPTLGDVQPSKPSSSVYSPLAANTQTKGGICSHFFFQSASAHSRCSPGGPSRSAPSPRDGATFSDPGIVTSPAKREDGGAGSLGGKAKEKEGRSRSIRIPGREKKKKRKGEP